MVAIKCPKCSYKWETRSLLLMVTCPNCGSKCKKEGETNVQTV